MSTWTFLLSFDADVLPIHPLFIYSYRWWDGLWEQVWFLTNFVHTFDSFLPRKISDTANARNTYLRRIPWPIRQAHAFLFPFNLEMTIELHQDPNKEKRVQRIWEKNDKKKRKDMRKISVRAFFFLILPIRGLERNMFWEDHREMEN